MLSIVRHGFRPVFIILISLFFIHFGDINSDPSTPYRDRPRIITKDGHITFEAGGDRDIVFLASGRGKIKVNGNDLSEIAAATTAIQQQNSVVANLTARVTALEQGSSGPTIYPHPGEVSNVIFMHSLEVILGTGPSALDPQFVRQSILKIDMLERQLQQLSTLIANGSTGGVLPPIPGIQNTFCGGVFTEESGVIKSPNYPDAYPAGITCNYTIRVPKGKIINLEFRSFDVEGSLDCMYDYLLIDESKAPVQSIISRPYFDNFNLTLNNTNRLCGNHIPLPVLSKFNELHLQFKTDGTVSNRGFMANYSTIDLGCGGVFTDLTGSFSSPNYPNSYPSHSKCNWMIRAPVGLIIRLTFTMFHLETQAKCNFDFVQVLDSDGSSLGKFCGSRAPAAIQSTSNEMLVKFQADESRSHDGFAASYVFVNESSNCGVINLFGETGYIRSPGFPRFYPPLKDCVWVVNSQEGHQIRFNVTAFDMENHTNCDYDFLELRNGGEATSPLFGKFCGTTIPKEWISHSNKFYLRFKTDAVMTGSGFEIYFDTASIGCGGKLTSPSGLIESPNYPQSYGNNAECSWLIQVSSGSTISLILIEVDIEAHIQCMYDYLEIFDGESDKRPSLGKYCQKTSLRTINSKSNKLFIKFRSDTSQAGRGFRLTYTTNCTTTVSGYTGVIESPNYPNPYPSNMNCNWTIRAPIGNNITFEMNHFQLENGSVCQNDYLEILERSSSRLVNGGAEFKQLKKFCGQMNILPSPFNSSTNIAKVSFYADTFLAYSGFRLTWRANGCGGEFVNQQTGIIMSPGYPNGYPSSTGCLWHIRGEPGQLITLTIVELDLELAINCYFDYLRIYSGPDDSAPELINTCHRITKPITLTSTANEMTLKLFSDRSVTGRGFLANFFLDSGGCSFVNSGVEKGLITSPNYPATYSAPTDCIWNITVSPFHAIEMTIQDLSIPVGNNCNETFLSIYDGTERETLNEIQRFCGTVGYFGPMVVTTKSSNALVVLRDGGNNPGNGFKISYKSICGGTFYISKTSEGSFTSPNYPHGSVVVQHCNWTFIAENMEDKIIITFEQMFGMGNDQNSCSGNNRIIIRDGESPDSNIVANLCTNMIPKPIVSTGRSLQVQMIGTNVFKARYSSSTRSCGGKMTSDMGYFVSPGYPLGYPENTECVWEAVAPEGNRISYSIIDLMIQMTPDCTGDSLQLRDKSSTGPLIGEYCGNNAPTFPYNLNVTTSNTLWVKFKSTARSPSGGFEAKYQMVYGGNLDTDSGTIESPGYNIGIFPLRQTSPVIWYITTTPGTRIKISFVDMDLGSNIRAQCFRTVRILDGLSENSPELGSFCGMSLPNPVITTMNLATVNLTNSPQESFRGKFKLTWTVLNSEMS